MSTSSPSLDRDHEPVLPPVSLAERRRTRHLSALLAQRARFAAITAEKEAHGVPDAHDHHPRRSPTQHGDATVEVPEVGTFSEQVRGGSDERHQHGADMDSKALRVLVLNDEALTTDPLSASDAGPAAAAIASHEGKYRDLWLWLQTADHVDVTFARARSGHWTGYGSTAVGRAIRDAGWRASTVNMGAETLTFVRATEGTPEAQRAR